MTIGINDTANKIWIKFKNWKDKIEKEPLSLIEVSKAGDFLHALIEPGSFKIILNDKK